MKDNQVLSLLGVGIGVILVVAYLQNKKKQKEAVINNPNALAGIAVAQETSVSADRFKSNTILSSRKRR